MDLDFIVLQEEIIGIIERLESITLATSSDDKVTARTMSVVNDGLVVMLQTGSNSEKAQQIKENPNVAFAAQNMQIEAIAQISGHPNESQFFIDKYKSKYPQYHAQYTNSPDEILVTATPTKISLYKYVDGKPCIDVLDVKENKAYQHL